MPNRLAEEPSPYLRQHADNPVDWWPWGEEAFAEARRRDVPVFLSIGYATCHWCHVMAHESFEDPEVARLLNEAFVCVKVDREERPDVDEACMAACQLMTGSGGWPLTALLDHRKRAFFAGTYFPRESRHGRIGMLDLIPRVAEAWREKRQDLEAQAEHILQHLRGEAHGHGDGEFHPAKPAAAGVPLHAVHLDAAAADFAKRFDPKHGGFGSRPKFPSPHNLLFLLRHHHRTGERSSLEMAVATLEALQRGGIRDHLGGGFHRYSTDEAWLLPHFEKMLYDQALLAFAYAEAHHATGRADFAATCRATLDYVLRDLADPAGGLRCAEDADSEGEEGKFYLWSLAELRAVLGADADRFAQLYGATAAGNHHDEATGQPTGSNILHLPRALTDEEEAWAAPRRARLLEARGARVRPLLDDKVLSDWNGLAVAALAAAARILAEPRHLAAAQRCAGFLWDRLRTPAGRLRHRWRDGAVDELGFLDDHAFLLWGLLELHQAGQDPVHLERAVAVAGEMEKRFAHPDGGWSSTPSDGEDLGVRKRDATDGALPSGNGVAAWSLHRLALLTGDTRWRDAADRALAAHAAEAARFPMAFPALLLALDVALGPSQELVVAGEGAAARQMLEAARRTYRPRLVVLHARDGLAKAAPWTAGHKPIDGKPAAYLCVDHACRQPVTQPAELARLLHGAVGLGGPARAQRGTGAAGAGAAERSAASEAGGRPFPGGQGAEPPASIVGAKRVPSEARKPASP